MNMDTVVQAQGGDPGDEEVAGSLTVDADHQLAPFNPTSVEIQEKLLGLLKLRSDDVLFDLGCGDGRFLITAASRVPGLRCVGIEYDSKFVVRANDSIARLPENVRDRIDIREGDLLTLGKTTQLNLDEDQDDAVSDLQAALTDATAIYVYLLPKGIKKIKHILDRVLEHRMTRNLELRVVTYLFQIHGWEPTVVDTNTKSKSPMYLYHFSPQRA